MFGIGGVELILILVFGFLIFGPDKLPAIAKTVGQAIAKFRNAQEEMTKVIKTEVYDPNSDEPFKNPLEVLSKLEDSTKTNEKTESFSERKAKYDKERATKKAAEEKAAAEKPDEKPEVKPDEKPEVKADELFGNKPQVKKTPTKAATDAEPAETPAASKPTATKPATPRTAKPATDTASKPVAATKTDTTSTEKGE
ncbi:MAG: twin-arginine translocase TatA/TatE family subunit [Raoultibacter sp.]